MPVKMGHCQETDLYKNSSWRSVVNIIERLWCVFVLKLSNILLLHEMKDITVSSAEIFARRISSIFLNISQNTFQTNAILESGKMSKFNIFHQNHKSKSFNIKSLVL